ncbi:ATPase [Candidatus Dependentiae bacterium]|nr:MAG: ATPase [Candidatus Dependentiae bacterium]
MSFSFYIIKASGEKELFDINKFKRSLKRCGAPTKLIMKIARKIEQLPDIRTTRQIYAFALTELEKANPVLAALYNLKQALLRLGPSGFPFEQFVAKIFNAQGYMIKLNQIVPGYCVDHELDLTAIKGKKHIMVECKFHNRQGLKSDVKIPLYIKARFDDIEKAWHLDPKHGHEFHKALITTNTKFTIQARDYAKCVGIQLLDWSYPRKANLPLLIQKYSLYPVTTLTTLSHKEQKLLIKKGIVLCQDISENEWALKEVGLTARQRQHVIRNAKELCKFTYA